MNGYERIKSALEGRHPDCTPVMLHNFMMAAHEAGYTMEEFRNDPRKIADSFIRAVEKYDYDGILVDIDLNELAETIVISPNSEDWFINLVGNTIKKYGHNYNLNKSKLGMKPYM